MYGHVSTKWWQIAIKAPFQINKTAKLRRCYDSLIIPHTHIYIKLCTICVKLLYLFMVDFRVDLPRQKKFDSRLEGKWQIVGMKS